MSASVLAPLAVALLMAGACSKPDPGTERVLYLHEALPADGSVFGRVNPRTYDLGSMTTAAPEKMELRACGDVVAFAGAGGVLSDEQLQVDEVLYRVWWYSGVGRGVFSLWAPGLGGGQGRVAVSSCAVLADDPRHEAGFFRTTARVPIGRLMSAQDLAQLHLLLDVANSQVVIGSCPGRASLLVLNPPSDDVLRKRDSDEDGVTDYDELYGTGDPWRADDGAQTSCLAHADPMASMPLCPAETAPDAVAGPTEDVRSPLKWEGKAVRVQGVLTVRAPLQIIGSTVVFEPDAKGRSGLEIVAGGALDVSGASVLAAADPAEGFALVAQEGSRLSVVDSRLDHPGQIELEADGDARHQGIVIGTAETTFRGNTVRFGLSAIEVMANGVVIEDTRFEHDGTGVLVRAEDVVVRGNSAVGGGVFVAIDDNGHRAQVTDNKISRTVDNALVVRDGARDVVITGNELLDVHRGLNFRTAPGLQVRGNRIRSCVGRGIPATVPGQDVGENELLNADPKACRVVLETSLPNDPDQLTLPPDPGPPPPGPGPGR